MRLPRILSKTPLIAGQSLALDKQNSKHLHSVLRLKVDAPIQLFNGEGAHCLASISQFEQATVHVTLADVVEQSTAPRLHIHLGLPMSKGDRMDYAIQKSVEAGVMEITPLTSEFCVIKLDAKRQQKKLQHWQGIIESACEQSGRNYLAKLNPIIDIKEWISSTDASLKLVFDGGSTQGLHDLTAPSANIASLIGPEGGLSSTEVKIAQRNDFIAIKLGNTILRTETAALATTVALQTLWGDY